MSRTTPPRLAPTSTTSPCVSVCAMHADGSHCLGCFRTLDEIGGWSRYSDDQRREVLVRVEERRAARREEQRALRHVRAQTITPGS